jgi:hypothetical protein
VTSTVTRLVSRASVAIEFLRQRTVNFTVEGFDAGEALQSLAFDGIDVTPGGVVADSSGNFAGAFTIPSGVPAGTKLVEFVGDQGSFGLAEYTGQGTLVVRRWRRTTTITQRRFDPLAQSFTLETGRHLTGVDFKFAEIGDTSTPVLVQIRESDNGFPSQTVIADAVIPGTDLTTANTYVRADFGTPVYLEGGTEFFVVLITDDATHAVRVAELGKYDSNASRFVTAQPYTVGVLLSSSNASTWTPHQEKDLTFRLVGAAFTATQQTINLGSITAANMTDLQALAPVDLPSNDTSVSFRYTRTTGEVFNLAPGQSLQFDTSITDTIQVQAVLDGSNISSPVLFPGVQSVIGTVASTASYQSREFQIGTGGTTMRVIFDAVTAGTASVVPEYDNGGFQGMALASTTQLEDNLVEYVYEDTGISGLAASKVKLSLTGTPAHRPFVRNIRAVMI